MKMIQQPQNFNVKLLSRGCQFLVMLFIQILFIQFTPILAYGKGGWNGSGGGGIACFKDAATRNRATTAAGIIKDHYINQILSLNTVEMQSILDQYSNPDLEILMPKTSESPTDFVRRILMDEMRKHQPTAAFNILAALEHLKFQDWKPKLGLKVIKDYGPAVRPRANCRYVQMAVRFAKPHEAEEMPHAMLDFDPRLIERMKSLQSEKEFNLNLATLLLHESIGYLTYDFHKTDNNSLDAQNLTIILLSQSFWRHMNSSEDKISRASFQNLVRRLKLNKTYGKGMNEYL